MSVGGSDGVSHVGDTRFAEVYARCYRPIWDYCRRRVAAEGVDDAVADTFLIVWRRLDEVPAGEAALVWTYGVAYRVIGHQWRSTARRRRLEDLLGSLVSRPMAAADESAGDADECRLVVAALARLGDTDAEMLRLVAWEQLSVADIATVLEIEPDAARQRLRRARLNLARHYGRLQSRRFTTPVAPVGGAS